MSLPGVIGAAMGLGIGILDFGMIASLIRRALEARRKANPEAASAGTGEGILRVLFVINALVFAGLGYWFGSTIGG